MRLLRTGQSATGDQRQQKVDGPETGQHVFGDQTQPSMLSYTVGRNAIETNRFPVRDGRITVYASANPSPPNCYIPRGTFYSMRLWKEVNNWPDEDHGSHSFRVGTDIKYWPQGEGPPLPAGTYYLEITNNHRDCSINVEVQVT